jgi:hypothetical protein
MITVARHANTLWSILLLIGIDFVGRAAFAKYGGGTGEPNDPCQIAAAEAGKDQTRHKVSPH